MLLRVISIEESSHRSVHYPEPVEYSHASMQPVIRKDLVTGGTIYIDKGQPFIIATPGKPQLSLGGLYQLVPYDETKEV